MKKNLFVGAGTALATPFKQDGKIDWVAKKWLVEKQIAGGVDFLVPCGTTGESPTLSHKEHDQVVAFVVEQVNGRVPVLAGTGSNSTAEAVKLTKAAKKCGADGVLVVSPYYNKPTQQGIENYYRQIADVGLPIILYDIPGRCGGQGVAAKTILKLSYDGVICGLKWASGNLDQLQDVLANRLSGFKVFSGDDNLTFTVMALGGDGVISVLSNLLPKEITDFVRNMNQGKLSDAREQHYKLLNLMRAMFIESNPLPIKTALYLVHPGNFQDNFRSPMCQMSAEGLEKLTSVLTTHGLL